MAGKRLRATAIIWAALAASPSFASVPLCPNVHLTNPIEPAFTGNEVVLLCGESAVEGWEEIPPNQAALLARGFLQSRGYLRPNLELRGAQLRITPGPITRVGQLTATGAPENFDVTKYQEPLGQALTPKLLDSVEQWSRHELTRSGYPCSTARASGGPDGILHLTIQPGTKLLMNTIRVTDTAAGDEGRGENPDLRALRRFDPFAPGAPYQSELLAISADRAVSAGLVERAAFVPICPADRGIVEQQVTPGGPNLLSAGFSFDTEQLAILRLVWRRTRLGSASSTIETEGRISSKVQSATAKMELYPEPESRTFFQPLLEFRHQNEDPLESSEERVQLAYSGQRDIESASWSATLGPQLQFHQISKSPSPITPSGFRALDWNARLRAVSHGYEFSRNKTRPGSRLALDLDWNDRSVLSDFGALRFQVNGEILIGWEQDRSPRWITAVRTGISYVRPQGGLNQWPLVPPQYLRYAGGISDLRGFGRMELPGALSAWTTALELRRSWSPKRVQGVAFFDSGLFAHTVTPLPGNSSFHWSPGIGVDYQSPVGNLLATVAHGFSGTEPGHWQLYLSLGETL